MDVVLTLLASSALDTAKRSERLRLLEQALDLCKADHSDALAKGPGTQFCIIHHRPYTLLLLLLLLLLLSIDIWLGNN